MTDQGTVPTMDVLHSLGFRRDPMIVSHEDSTITFDFGILKLQATACLNLRCEQIVLFLGVISTPRTLGEVHFELPEEIESVKVCAALIAWNLDQFFAFRGVLHVDWVEEGRRNKRLLPSVKTMAEWNARPRFIVNRAWLRLALNKLAKRLYELPDEATVRFSFDGSVFSIWSDGELIAMAGKGAPWNVDFNVLAGSLRRLPRRLKRENVEISIWQARISIGNWTYQGILEGVGSTDPCRVQ